jgi:hypothetical protein
MMSDSSQIHSGDWVVGARHACYTGGRFGCPPNSSAAGLVSRSEGAELRPSRPRRAGYRMRVLRASSYLIIKRASNVRAI